LTLTLSLVVLIADSGSRGAVVKNTIRNYFVSQNDGAASFNHINSGAPATKEGKDSKESVVVKTEPLVKTEPVDLTAGAMPPPSKTAPTAKIVVNAQQQQVGTILELKKQIDQLRLAKEIAETRVSHEASLNIDSAAHNVGPSIPSSLLGLLLLTHACAIAAHFAHRCVSISVFLVNVRAGGGAGGGEAQAGRAERGLRFQNHQVRDCCI
jgi:hypothetical protein